jgi:hypothetical protein
VNWPAVIGISSFFLFLGCAIAANVCSMLMLERVNQLLPSAERYSPLGWWAGKTLRLYRDYERLYPDGRLRRYVIAFTVIAGTCLVAAALAVTAISQHPTIR